MFYHLEGVVAEFDQNLVVIDCGGIGFAVNTTTNTMSRLHIGEKSKLYISESIGETNFDLYGFALKAEKRWFEMLLSISGVGPKAALSILSYNDPDSLALSIMNDDVKALTVAPGIGKKIAQRVILELKDKIGKGMTGQDLGIPAAAAAQQTENTALNDAMGGLSVLGYSSPEIAPTLKKIQIEGMSAEQIIKAVLKQMVK